MAEISGPAESAAADDEPELNEQENAGFPLDEDDPGRSPYLPPSADSGATRALASLMGLTPFLDLHKHFAKRTTANTDRSRLVCFTLDLLLRLTVVLLILFILAAFAWKTLAPLPEPWWDDDDAEAPVESS